MKRIKASKSKANIDLNVKIEVPEPDKSIPPISFERSKLMDPTDVSNHPLSL